MKNRGRYVHIAAQVMDTATDNFQGRIQNETDQRINEM